VAAVQASLGIGFLAIAFLLKGAWRGLDYDRRNLLATTDGLPSDCSTLILPDADRDSLLEEWKRAGDYQTLNPLAYDGSDLLKSVAKIPKVLKKTASYQAIERLKKNRAVENWVREGLLACPTSANSKPIASECA